MAVSNQDNNPIGTILTVPKNTELRGYIDYVVGRSFVPDIYPDLYNALGSNVFVGLTPNTDYSLPIGSIIPFLSTKPVPEGYIEWSTKKGILKGYPKLIDVFMGMANSLSDGESREQWIEALLQESLPEFEGSGFFLGYGNSTGLYSSDTMKQVDISFYPMAIEENHVLRAYGCSDCKEHKETIPSVYSDVMVTESESPYVILANHSHMNGTGHMRHKSRITIGNGSENKPKSLSVRLLIKAEDVVHSNVPSTHKQVIKAFN